MRFDAIGFERVSDARIARAAEWQQGVTEVSIALRIVLQLEGAQMSASVSSVSTSGMVGGRGSGRDQSGPGTIGSHAILTYLRPNRHGRSESRASLASTVGLHAGVTPHPLNCQYERIDSRPTYCARALPHGERASRG